MALHLSVTVEPDGSWRLALGHRDERRATGMLSAEFIAGLLGEIAALLSPDALPVIGVAGRDVHYARMEEAIGDRLSRALNATPALAARLAGHLSTARLRGKPLTVVVDAEDPSVRSLPWELIGAAPGRPAMEAVRDGVIARLTHGTLRPAAEPTSDLGILLWVPDRADVLCSRLAADVCAIAETLGMPAPVPLDPGNPVWPADWPEDRAAVLHVICHGRRSSEQVALVVGDAARGVATEGAVLVDVLSRAALAVLHVCEGGDATPMERENLASRFTDAGVPACVAPTRQLSADAALAFSRGLYEALWTGCKLTDSVAEGRRRVRGLALPFPDSRWHNLALFVGSLAAVTSRPLVAARWTPTGWPRCAPEVSVLLEAARALALQHGSGFVGVEHLVLALPQAPGGGRVTVRARQTLTGLRDALMHHLGFYLASGTHSGDPSPTARLLSYADRLHAGFNLDDLWEVIFADGAYGLAVVTQRDLLLQLQAVSSGDETIETSAPASLSLDDELLVGGSPDILEAICGPEDGRRLRPKAGHVLGRWSKGSPEVEMVLYRDTLAVDRTLSRRHITWRGEATVELVKRAIRIRRGRREDVPAGPTLVQPGDILVLTPGTSVRALCSSER